MDFLHTVDILHTSDHTSNTLICWEYEQDIPTVFKGIEKMNYAHLTCLQEHPDNVKMELIKVKSWNKHVLRIESDNKQQLSTLKHSMKQKFKYVLYQRKDNDNKNKIVYNAKNDTDNKANNNNNNNTNTNNKSDYDNYSADADEESGNDDYFEHSSSHKTKRYKKNTKQIKKERKLREQKKYKQQNQNNNTKKFEKNKNIKKKSKESALPRPSTPSASSCNSSYSSPKSNLIQTLPSNCAPPPNFAIDDYDPSHNPIIHEKYSSPPKPNFNFQEENLQNLQNQSNQENNQSAKPQIVKKKEKEKEMKRPSLPVFDFGAGIQYDNIVSDNRSSMDCFEAEKHFVDHQYLSNPPPIPNSSDFGNKLKYKKTQKQYNKYSQNRDNNHNNNNNNNNYNNTYRSNNNNKFNNNNKNKNNNNHNPNNQPHKKKVRNGPPVLSELFGDCQSHEEYLTFHEDVRNQYSEKLKTSPKREKNPKNYFLLPILTIFYHYEIGSKIGARDYGFICDSGLNNGPLKGRDSNSYDGVDFQKDKKSEKDDNKVEKDEKNPISLLLQVMQCKKEIDYQLCEYYDQSNIQKARFEFQFILRNSNIAYGESNTKKQDAKKQCAQNALNRLRNDANYRDIIIRKESGIKGSGKKDEAPLGYEYPIVLSHRYNHRRGKYSYDMISAAAINNKDIIRLQKKNSGYDRNMIGHRLDIFMDRGYFVNHQADDDNPNVEELYAKQWSFYQGDHNIPKHCHPYLDEYGKFIKPFKDSNEKQLWKGIWRFYKNSNFANKKNFNPEQQHKRQQGRSFDNKSASNSVFSSYKDDANNYKYNNKNNNELQITINKSNNNMNKNKNINNDNNKLQYSHLIIYDFDGCVYAQRLLRDSKKQKDPDKYLSELSDKQIKEIGWKLKRIDAINNHFNKLSEYKPNLGIVLHSFHKIKHLNKVFQTINVNIKHYFDIILCIGHNIVCRVTDSKNLTGGKYSKNMMIELLCKEYNVLTNNTLYVDDDPNIKQDVKCCQVFQTKKRDGISQQEMNEIESKIKYQYKLGQKEQYQQQHQTQNQNRQQQYQQQYQQQNNYNENNNNNVYMENCLACGLSYNKKELNAIESFWLCKDCFYNNCDENRMNMVRPNQYYANNNHNYHDQQ